MQSDNCNGSRAASARGFMALFAMLTMGLGLLTSQAEAAPFAYVANFLGGTVSVIDTATTPPSVTATVGVGVDPSGVAVAPDGKHVYVTNNGANIVSVIATATNTVVATIPVGSFPGGVAVTPDGKHVYVANFGELGNGPVNSSVSVIDTATNPPSVTATVTVGNAAPFDVAVTPDGKHVYVATIFSDIVSVIDTTTTPRP